MVGAVIYIRVSTKEQTENLSLPTQLRACEEYCRREGLEILERFKEEGESAKTADRTELQRLLTFCRTNKGKRPLRGRLQPDALRAGQVRPLRAALAPAVAGHLAAVGDRADRRHVHRQADGRRAGRVRAVRQRRALGSHARRHAGRAGARALGVPGAARLPQRAARDGQEPDARSGTRADRAPGLRGVRDRPLHEAADPAAGDDLGPDGTAGACRSARRRSACCCAISSTPASSTCPEYGVREKRGDFEPLVSEDLFYRAQAVLSGRVPTHRAAAAQRIRTSRCAGSCAARPAAAASRGAGRRDGASTTPTTTAGPAAAP